MNYRRCRLTIRDIMIKIFTIYFFFNRRRSSRWLYISGDLCLSEMVLTKVGHHRADLAHFGEGNLHKFPLVMVKLVNLCHSYMFILILMLQALHLIHVEVAVVGYFDRCHHSLQRNVTIRSRQIIARRVRYSYSPWIDYIDNNYVYVIYTHNYCLYNQSMGYSFTSLSSQ